MQNKAAIIVLAIALGLVSIYQLSFTVATYKVKKEARAYVQALQDYWNFFYNIRSLTLFDFIKRKPLETDYDKLVQ